MAQIFKIRTPDGNVVTPGDWTGAEPLWSTIEIAEGNFQRQVAFSYGIGAPSVPGSRGPRKATDADTNLEGEGSRLPENEELVIFNVACECFQIDGPGDTDTIPVSDPPMVTALNILRLQRDLLVEMRIASVNKIYLQAPLSYFPASTGVKEYNSGARSFDSNGASGFIDGNNGSHNAHDVRELASPLRVRGGETFGIDFSPGPGSILLLDITGGGNAVAGRIRIRTFLDGYRRRPVA